MPILGLKIPSDKESTAFWNYLFFLDKLKKLSCSSLLL